MKYMKVNEIREKYLEFFEKKGHLKVKSYSLIPENDKSLLLISAGMAPLKPFFTGLLKPPSKKMTTCQKCMRTGDIENAGLTARHCTFFEMLGNFSFGDYFKEDAIKYAWEFLTETLEIPKEKLYVTVYEEDDEALELWDKNTDVGRSRIFKLGKEDNFWEIGVGPCGPSSEIHFNRGTEIIKTTEQFTTASDNGTIVEIWNLVFTQFDKDEDGNYNPLKNPNIDTGMGLERLACAIQGVETVAEIDTVQSILLKISEISKIKYGTNKDTDIAQRIISDHIKSVVFMISDGVMPSNEGRGYVLRRLLRRAARYGKLIGIRKEFLRDLVNVVIENYACEYTELEDKKEYIREIISIEEEKFMKTLDQGMEMLKTFIEDTKEGLLDGDKAFKLYDTYGFPIELTREMLKETGIEVDVEKFKIRMEDQRRTARDARGLSNYMGSNNNIINKIPSDFVCEFVGYDKLETEATLKYIIKDNTFVNEIYEGEEGIIIFDKTPFYAEKGGQVGDEGRILGENGGCMVENCVPNITGVPSHTIKMYKGSIKIGEKLKLNVNEERRKSITRNHSATHLLHSALTKILGSHIKQLGSYVDRNRLRFDFNHIKSISDEELLLIENMVNQSIMRTMEVTTEVISQELARKEVVKAQFNEKYGDVVRVVKMGDFSSEFCGGTHVKNTGAIGPFKIMSESGIASGTRRIEAITGNNTLMLSNFQDNILKQVSGIVKGTNENLINKIDVLIKESKEKDKIIETLNLKMASLRESEILNEVENVGGVKLLISSIKNVDVPTQRNLCEKLRSKLGGTNLVILLSENQDKINVVAMATKDIINTKLNCGKIVKQICEELEGNGGGRPDMAQGGCKKVNNLDEYINKFKGNITQNL